MRDQLLQRNAIDILHRNENATLSFADFVNSTNIAMSQFTHHFGFPLKPRHLRFGGAMAGIEHFNGDGIDEFITGTPDRSHPPFSDMGNQTVATQNHLTIFIGLGLI